MNCTMDMSYMVVMDMEVEPRGANEGLRGICRPYICAAREQAKHNAQRAA